MRKHVFVPFLAAMFVCAGLIRDVTAPRAAGPDQASIVETIFIQPAVIDAEVDSRVIGDVQPPNEFFCVRMANLGTNADVPPVRWDVGRYTGLRLGTGEAVASHQRGPDQPGEGTAVQLAGNEIGVWIDSDHPRPERGALIPVCPAFWWLDEDKAPRPFQAENRALALSFDMRVPTAEREAGAEVYISAYFLLRDRTSRHSLWLGAAVFDLRGIDRFPDTVHLDDWEAGTGLPILFTALHPRSAWLHPGPHSSTFADKPFADYRRFEFRVGPRELQTAIRAMKARWPDLDVVSEDSGDFQLTHFNVNPEVSAPPGSRGRLGLSVRDLRLHVIAPDAP